MYFWKFSYNSCLSKQRNDEVTKGPVFCLKHVVIYDLSSSPPLFQSTMFEPLSLLHFLATTTVMSIFISDAVYGPVCAVLIFTVSRCLL